MGRGDVVIVLTKQGYRPGIVLDMSCDPACLNPPRYTILVGADKIVCRPVIEGSPMMMPVFIKS